MITTVMLCALSVCVVSGVLAFICFLVFAGAKNPFAGLALFVLWPLTYLSGVATLLSFIAWLVQQVIK